MKFPPERTKHDNAADHEHARARLMSDLINRLEAATGPDRKLEWAIWEHFNVELKNDFARAFVPRYTESLDAALTLMPEGYRWELGVHPNLGFCAEVWTDLVHRGFGSIPAIALLIAILRARESD
jgi:hypothetical protein